MKFRIMRPNMAIRKKRIKLSREVVHDLKEVSKLSCVKQCELQTILRNGDSVNIVTSKKQNRVEGPEIDESLVF